MLYKKLIGRTGFSLENIAHIEFYLKGLLPKILAIYTKKDYTKLKRKTNRKLKLSLTENKEIGYSLWFAHALNLT